MLENLENRPAEGESSEDEYRVFLETAAFGHTFYEVIPGVKAAADEIKSELSWLKPNLKNLEKRSLLMREFSDLYILSERLRGNRTDPVKPGQEPRDNKGGLQKLVKEILERKTTRETKTEKLENVPNTIPETTQTTIDTEWLKHKGNELDDVS